MTDQSKSIIEGASQEEKPLPDTESAALLEEFKEARSILFEDLSSEEAAALLNEHNKRKYPFIRRADNGLTLSEIASQAKIKRSNYDSQFKTYESYVKDPKSYLEETKDVINNIKEIINNFKSNAEDSKAYSDYDLLVQKVSLLEDAVCSALKNKLQAERNYRLAEAQLNIAYQELYAQPLQKDSNLEKNGFGSTS